MSPKGRYFFSSPIRELLQINMHPYLNLLKPIKILKTGENLYISLHALGE